MHEIMGKILMDQDSPLKKGSIDFEKREIISSNYLESYILSCSRALSSTHNAIQSAKLSLSLLTSTAFDTIATNNDEKGELIQLWVENSIIRIQSIYDRVLILVNNIFDLGLANESISHNIMVCNRHVKEFNIARKLKAIHKRSGDYRVIRNTVIHHERYHEEGLDNVTLYLQTNHMSIEQTGNPFIEQNVIDSMIQEYIDTKKKKLTEYIDGIEGELNNLYTALIPIYDYKKKLFSKLS